MSNLLTLVTVTISGVNEEEEDARWRLLHIFNTRV